MKNIVKTVVVLFTALSFCLFAKAQEVKNIIFMIGDGMSLAAVSAASVEQNYRPLNLERAQYIGLAKTYSANNRVTDSAASGTALATGHKTDNNMLGVTPDQQAIPSIREIAQNAGFSTGVVATYSVTNATPAAFVSHVKARQMEEEIALDYLKYDIDVFMGGGTKFFCNRKDGRNLTIDLKAKGFTVATDLNQIESVNKGKVAVLTAPNAMPHMSEGRGDFLPRATKKALEILNNNNKKGFFVMVEGSQIDGQEHDNNIVGTIEELKDFDMAVKEAFDFADSHPGTLVVITADHETGGLTLVSAKPDFSLPEQGIDYKFSTTGHTGGFVPIYAYGTGAENFSHIMDNTDIPKIMKRLLGLE